MSDINILQIWKHVHDKIKIITSQNLWDLPDLPGVYGWFLPFYEYNENIKENINIISDIMLYDASSKGIPISEADAAFNWEIFNIRLEKRNKKDLKSGTEAFWEKLTSGDLNKQKFLETLLIASIFSSPLYVGKAKNLRERYEQHVKGANPDSNTFYKRFTSRMSEIDMPLTVSDLIFICVPLTTEQENTISNNNSNGEAALEDILMKIIKPVYSDR